MKTVTLLTSGTRGDVLPYIALGEGLQSAGYNIRIAAPVGFASLVQTSGLIFSAFEGNPSDLLIGRGDSTPLTLGKNIRHSIQASQRFIQQARPLYRRMLQTAAEACKGSDLIIYGLPTIWGAHIAEGLRIPAVRAVLQPLAATREFSSALLPFRFSLGEIGNLLSHWIVIQSVWLAWRAEINHARRTQFGLGRAHWLDPSLQAASHQPLVLNGYSEAIVPRPKDWNQKQIITGYWRKTDVERYSNPELQRYLEASPNPVAISFGSPGTNGFHKTLALIEEAVNTANAQAILIIPSKWHARGNSKNIFLIEYVPHSWLYPRVRAAIHHGGAGTTSASLHAGVPAIVLPLAIDQFFWGERIHQAGLGPQPIPQRNLTAKKLADAIQQGLNDSSMREKAKAVSERLSREDGVQAAMRVMRECF